MKKNSEESREKIGLMGKKLGMTRSFSSSGVVTPVTVLQISGNFITQIKEKDHEGYDAIQVGYGIRKEQRTKSPVRGHCQKAGLNHFPRSFVEFRLLDRASSNPEISIGQELSIDLFQVGDFLNIRGVTIGKGFAGTVKRHNFSCQPASHGNSLAHRAPGSIGQNQSPRKVFKNRKMAGRMGGVCRTVQNQKIIQVDKERSLLWVAGSVPGPKNAFVKIEMACKPRG